MSQISDELLMAYVDGELGSADRRRVEAAIERDLALHQRLQDWERSSALLARLFSSSLMEPVPERLLRTVLEAPMYSRAEPGFAYRRASSQMASYARMVSESWFSWRVSAALAAGLVAGFGVGWGALKEVPRASGPAELLTAIDGRLMAGDRLAGRLESVPSGSRVALFADRRDIALKPIFSFENQSREYCRQYVLEMDATHRFSGVGCRDNNGRWRLEVHAPVASSTGDSSKVVVAGDDKSPAVEGAVDRMISGDLLDAASEARVMSNGWRKAH